MSIRSLQRSVLTLLGLFACALLTTTTLRGVADADVRPHADQRADPTIVAHRGASGYAPENTLPAVRLGIAMDVDKVEVDVQQTKDGKLVVMHDTTLDRTTDVEKVFPKRAHDHVGDFTFDEIRKLDAGSWKGAKYAGTRVPTLGEVMDTLAGAGVGLLLEAKEPALYEGITKRIAKQLRGSPYWRNATQEKRLTVVSFDADFLQRFHGLVPDYVLGLNGTPGKKELRGVAGWSAFANPTFADLDADLVDAIHDSGMRTYTWTVDDRADMDKAVDLGVDGIVTNKPDLYDRSAHAA